MIISLYLALFPRYYLQYHLRLTWLHVTLRSPWEVQGRVEGLTIWSAYAAGIICSESISVTSGFCVIDSLLKLPLAGARWIVFTPAAASFLDAETIYNTKLQTSRRYIAIHQVSLLSHASYSYSAGGVRCPRQRRQRQRVTEGTAMAPWNGPNQMLSGRCDWMR